MRKEFFMRGDKGVKRLSVLFDSDAARSLQHIISITTRRKMQRDKYRYKNDKNRDYPQRENSRHISYRNKHFVRRSFKKAGSDYK